jgi:flagellar motor switch protein FliN/FliY
MPPSDLNLPELSPTGSPMGVGVSQSDGQKEKMASDLQPVFDIPVLVQAVLGRTQMEVSNLLQLGPGSVIQLDRRVGEAIDIYVNSRLVARGEVVIVDDRLGVTMTEIIKNADG